MANAQATIKYVIVVLKEIVRIALIIAALNDVEVKLGDIFNAYAQASITEKIWSTLGPEFGENIKKITVIVDALYGLKSAGAAFRSHLSRCMEFLWYESCKADPNLWLKPKITRI